MSNTRNRLMKIASTSRQAPTEPVTKVASSQEEALVEAISAGLLGPKAQAALSGIKEAQALATQQAWGKFASSPESYPVLNDPEVARQQRLNTLLRRY